MVDAVAARSNGTAPMTTPSTIPAATAIAEADHPGTQGAAAAPSQNSARPSSSASAAPISLVGGR